MKIRKPFYGWIIVACGTLIIALATGISLNCYGLFIIPVQNDLGVTRAQMNFSQTLLNVGAMVISVSAGYLFKRYKLKSLMKISAIGIGASLVAYSFTKSIGLIYVLCLLISVFNTLLAFLPFTIILNNWFKKKIGLAIGIAFMGSGLGGMIFNNIIGSLLGSYSWRVIMLGLGILCLAAIIPIVFFVVKISPYEMGLKAYGEEEGQEVQFTEYGMGFKAALHTPRFAMVIVGFALIGLFCSAFTYTLTPYLQDIGYSVSESAFIYSSYMAVLVLGKIGLGWISDRIGTPKTLTGVFAAMMVGVYSFIHAGSLTFAVLTVITMGAYETMTNVTVPLVTKAAFGTKDLSSINGVAYASNYVGSSIGPMFCGMVYSAQGSYVSAYWVMLAVGAVCMPLLILASRSKKVQG